MTDAKSTLVSDNAFLDNSKNVVVFTDNVNVKDASGDLDCDKLELYSAAEGKKSGGLLGGSSGSKFERAVAIGRVRVTTDEKSTLVSDNAVFYQNENRAVFSGNVHAQDDAGKLDCDKLMLYLSRTTAEKSDRVAGGTSSGNRLERAVAIGRVHMTDPKSVLDCDVMTLSFTDGQGSTAPVSGLLHSGNSRLSRIVCDGNVRGETRGDETPEKAKSDFGMLGANGRGDRRFSSDILVSDQIKDVTELHGNVIVRDDETKLECDEMFIYGKPKTEVAGNSADDPDADPFSLMDSESYAPSRVLLDSDSELDKVVCDGNVRITNGKDGKLSRAEGDHGLYRVSDRRFTITSIPGKYCRIRSDGRIQRCEKIHYELEYERFIGESAPGRAVYSEIDQEPIPKL